MYCGLTNNAVLVFDIRNTKDHIYKLIEPTEKPLFSPIHSMHIVNSQNNTSTLVCSNLEHVYCWKTNENNTGYEYGSLKQSTESSQDKSDSKVSN